MPRYRTEIIVAPDRYVCLQLPPDFPEGRAAVAVYLLAADGPDGDPGRGGDLDREDIEWWDEFDDETDPAPPR